jgi:NAD(P)-dependent dehydrogenase (short-subunit alcohol dehydrogenase family)
MERPLLSATGEYFDQMMAVDVRGHFFMMKHAVPEMRKVGGEAIVNFSSAAALRGRRHLWHHQSRSGHADPFLRSHRVIASSRSVCFGSVCTSQILTLRTSPAIFWPP